MKYMGSKAKIAKDILPFIDYCISTQSVTKYVELFMGGCNMLDKVQGIERYGSDYTKYLVALFEHLRSGGKLYDTVSYDLYADVRSKYKTDANTYTDWQVGNGGFLASYNGRWFDGGYAKSGIEKGTERYRDYYQEAKRNIESQIEQLKDVHFAVLDYKDYEPKGDELLYLDPPYANTKQYANAMAFDYDLFWEKVRNWSKDNYVLISEESAPEDFKILWEKGVTRSINAVNKMSKTERLYTYEKGKYALNMLNIM